jgi:hypothetical protein
LIFLGRVKTTPVAAQGNAAYRNHSPDAVAALAGAKSN